MSLLPDDPTEAVIYDIEELDLAGEDINPGTQQIRVVPYDPSRQREVLRSIIAGTLLTALVGTIVGSFWLLARVQPTADNLKDLLSIIYAPLIGIIGTALGFYFGTAERK